jgi:hypothetical protein
MDGERYECDLQLVVVVQLVVERVIMERKTAKWPFLEMGSFVQEDLIRNKDYIWK